MKAAAKDRQFRPRSRLPLIALIAAAVLSAVAVRQVRSVWLSLPVVQLKRIDAQAYARAFEQARGRMSIEAQEGLIAANLSSLLTAAWRDPQVYAASRDVVEQMTTRLRRTQVERLQLAVLVMLRLEWAGAPAEQWWPAVEPLLRGLERADFPHFMPALLAHYAAVFETLGLSPGVAWVQAQDAVGHTHGPFLQLLVDRLDQVAQSRREAGDDSAELCRLVVRRLLRQWVLDPGPLGLRLLAADLLAGELLPAETASAAADPRELADALREWRDARHDEAVMAFSLTGGGGSLMGAHPPAAAADAQSRAMRGLARVSWTLPSTCVAAAAALLLSPRHVRARSISRRGQRLAWGLGAALALVGSGAYYLWKVLLKGDPTDVVRHLGNVAADPRVGRPAEETGWPVEPLVAAGLTLVLLLLVAVATWRASACAATGAECSGRPPCRPSAGRAYTRGDRTALLSVVATANWLVLTLILLAYTQATEVSLSRYDSACLAAMKQQAGLSGPVEHSDRLLRLLREWDPAAAP